MTLAAVLYFAYIRWTRCRAQTIVFHRCLIWRFETHPEMKRSGNRSVNCWEMCCYLSAF